MMKSEILQGNSIIALFMGAKLGNGGTKSDPVYTSVPITHSNGETRKWTTNLKDLRYHTSWDWLMPVIDEISKVCKPYSEAHFYWNNTIDIRIFRETIEVTYAEIVKFIKWYNVQINKTDGTSDAG